VIEVVLSASGLADSFAVTVSGEEVARGKPAPDIYLAAAGKLGVDPAHAAAVEDSTNGLRAAAAAGLLVVALTMSGGGVWAKLARIPCGQMCPGQ
jgi:HAD superfamily hydrolase (TIGR01509 family)